MKPMSIKHIFKTWWPLAASWLLMGAELPFLSAVIARLANPEINLAAYGGVVFPIALIIEAPVIMLLAASTALSKDWKSYLKIRRFMMIAGISLTILHGMIAFTPLYYSVVVRLLGVPEEIVEPSRIGMMIMLPWTWSIAYRRFNQGVLIRFGHSNVVGLGTAFRLTADVVILTIGLVVKTIPGIVVGTMAVATGVIVEAIYAGIRVQPVLRNELKKAPRVTPELTWKSFSDFYIPLAMTSLLLLVVQPMGSAALSRMPNALESLAVWPVLGGLIFMFRSMGFAYNEVVVALLDEPQSVNNLRKFMGILAFGSTTLLLVIGASPIAQFWFEIVSALPRGLAEMAKTGLWVALTWPALAVFRNWFQGTIVHSRHTRGITEAVVVFLITSSSILFAGILYGKITGLYVGFAAFVIGTAAQVGWLWIRGRPILLSIEARDAAFLEVNNIGVASD